MKKTLIYLTKGAASGKTGEGAYCEALNQAGIINLNLITLSSVLPHHSRIVYHKPKFSYRDYGKKAYVIISQAGTARLGKTVCSGIGWVEELNGNGHGLVVQLQGDNEYEVRKKIRDSLLEILKRSTIKYSKRFNIITEKIICKKDPVCALVALVFSKLDKW